MIYHILFFVLIIGADCHLSKTFHFLSSNVRKNDNISRPTQSGEGSEHPRTKRYINRINGYRFLPLIRNK
jgi:hypothetical protein